MRVQPIAASQNRRIVAGLPFVEALARRMAASMPNSIDIGDLVQDGVLGLIDAAHRFDRSLARLKGLRQVLRFDHRNDELFLLCVVRMLLAYGK